jgi:hypothetical protein
MIRKWEWIREYCKRQGFKGSAEIADQIDRVLCYLYGEIDIKAWEWYVMAGNDGIKETGEINLSERDVGYKIAASGDFCIACKKDKMYGGESSDPCRDCMFDELTGRDDYNMSLYDEFFFRYMKESGQRR